MSRKLMKYIKVIITVVFLAVAFYYIGGEPLKYTAVEEEMLPSTDILPEPVRETILEQKYTPKMDYIKAISIYPYAFTRENQGNMFVSLWDGTTDMGRTNVDVGIFTDFMPCEVIFAEPIKVTAGKEYVVRFEFDCPPGQAPTLCYSADSQNVSALTWSNNVIKGQLCMGVTGTQEEFFGTYYWYFAAGVLIMILLYLLWSDYQEQRGKFTVITLLWAIWVHYQFLIKQLVARDFKVKYKRSVLGYCWSFLNPLLTMLVQYVVFSTIFKSGIDNFPVYLLSGNIIFGFFSDAVGQGLMSIIGNSSLITKVYVPKYIYPATKVMSSAINLFISIIPLLIVTLLTHGKINLTLLLLPYAIICLLIFCMGIVLLLSAANVFFRDVQYLWGIVSLIWMYATPIFYPAEIIPLKFQLIQTLNPMYYIITFVRSILIYGVSPKPEIYLWCFVSAVVTLALGVFVFKKTQGKFVLYI